MPIRTVQDLALSTQARLTDQPFGPANGLAMFLPAWNEAGSLPYVISDAVEHLRRRGHAFELIVVDDGSTDGTKVVLRNLCEMYPGLVSWVTHDRNQGYGAAIRSGLLACLSTGQPWIGYCDADGQIAPHDIGLLLDAAREAKADLAIGFRRNRAENLPRRLMSHGWHHLSRRVLGFNATDVDCGLKLFRRPALDCLAPRLHGNHATISPEILALAHREGFRMVEVGIEHRPRTSGSPSGARPDVVVRSIAGLIALRHDLNEAHQP